MHTHTRTHVVCTISNLVKTPAIAHTTCSDGLHPVLVTAEAEAVSGGNVSLPTVDVQAGAPHVSAPGVSDMDASILAAPAPGAAGGELSSRLSAAFGAALGAVDDEDTTVGDTEEDDFDFSVQGGSIRDAAATPASTIALSKPSSEVSMVIPGVNAGTPGSSGGSNVSTLAAGGGSVGAGANEFMLRCVFLRWWFQCGRGRGRSGLKYRVYFSRDLRRRCYRQGWFREDEPNSVNETASCGVGFMKQTTNFCMRAI